MLLGESEYMCAVTGTESNYDIVTVKRSNAYCYSTVYTSLERFRMT
jgi:hypothetical protein